MTRARYPMIEELRHRFEAHKRRYGRLPRSWMLNEKRWWRFAREFEKSGRGAIVEWTLVVPFDKVWVKRRAKQFRLSMPRARYGESSHQ